MRTSLVLIILNQTIHLTSRVGLILWVGSSFGSVGWGEDVRPAPDFRDTDPAPEASGGASGSEAFFRPAPDLAQQYDPEGIYPRGRIFPFSFFSVGGGSKEERGKLLPDEEVQAALQQVKQQGVSLIGPQYELNDRAIADARTHGLKCIYTVGLPMDFYGPTPVEKTAEQIREEIRQQVLAVADNPEIAWWYLTPEELRYWRDNEITYLEVAADAIRQADPLKRPVWMYDPGHRDAASLAHTVQHLDLCGKGMYTNYSGQRDSRVWVRWTIEQELQAIAPANPAAIPIAVPEMFEQPPEELLEMIPRWVRHDVYLSLISGAKGIVVFSRSERPDFSAHGAYAAAYEAIAHELNGPLHLGSVFLFGERRDDLRGHVFRGPSHVATAHEEPVEYPSVAVLDVAYGPDRYLFLANSSNEPVRVAVQGLPHTTITAENLFDPGDKQLVRPGEWEPDLEPLGIKAFRLVPTEGE